MDGSNMRPLDPGDFAKIGEAVGDAAGGNRGGMVYCQGCEEDIHFEAADCHHGPDRNLGERLISELEWHGYKIVRLSDA